MYIYKQIQLPLLEKNNIMEQALPRCEHSISVWPVCIYFFLNVTLFYIVKILSGYFFLYPSQPKYFFLKIQHQIICLAQNHVRPAPSPLFRLNGRSLNCIGCVFNFKLKQRKRKEKNGNVTRASRDCFRKPFPFFPISQTHTRAHTLFRIAIGFVC